MAFVAEQVTAVWPPTGIALVAVLLLGYRVWPGIALGALLANLTANEALPTACGIAAGNTLEALAGAWLLRASGFRMALGRLRDVLALVFLAAMLSTCVSATIGVASLCLSGLQPWDAFSGLWRVWWVGDAMGNLVMAPLLMVWAARSRMRLTLRRAFEAAALLSTLLVVGLLVLGERAPVLIREYPPEYIIFPLVIWAALRFGQRGTVTVTFIVSTLAIWGALCGAGPFAVATFNESLLLLHAYMSVVAVTGLLLGAVITERNTAERRRETDHAITHILAESPTLRDAAPRMLETICHRLEWDLGAFWTRDQAANVLRCMETWHSGSPELQDFESITRETTFVPGTGLPGRVWASGKPAWIPDVVADPNFPRAPWATRAGLWA